jgi:hypothetical protein
MKAYFTNHPNSKALKLYEQTLKIITNQGFIPTGMNIYDFEHEQETISIPTAKQETISIPTAEQETISVPTSAQKTVSIAETCNFEYNQKLHITFQWYDSYVYCTQDMWFSDEECKNTIDDIHKNHLGILFLVEKPKCHTDEEELEDKQIPKENLNPEALRPLFTWLHTFLMQTYKYDPFHTLYCCDGCPTTYQDYVPDFCVCEH